MSTPARPADPAPFAVRDAGPADLEDLLALGRRYNEADHHPFDEARTRRALTGLLESDRWGHVLVGDMAGTAVGYAVVTFGYSIESGGIEALLDEIYLDIRGQGLGAVLLDEVVERARQRGARRLFLETEAANHRARSFYLRHQFTADDSIWFSRWL